VVPSYWIVLLLSYFCFNCWASPVWLGSCEVEKLLFYLLSLLTKFAFYCFANVFGDCVTLRWFKWPGYIWWDTDKGVFLLPSLLLGVLWRSGVNRSYTFGLLLRDPPVPPPPIGTAFWRGFWPGMGLILLEPASSYIWPQTVGAWDCSLWPLLCLVGWLLFLVWFYPRLAYSAVLSALVR